MIFSERAIATSSSFFFHVNAIAASAHRLMDAAKAVF